MSKIQELLKNKTDKIDYGEVIKNYPWIMEGDHNCILSPDSDGLLCGLFMSTHLNWKIKGFYDGKIMILDKNISAKDCIFLDIEVFRKEIRSVGHHMVLYNKRYKPPNWNNFDNCIQPNILRNYDGYTDFRLKYPLATIHFLIGILGSRIQLCIPETAICPLFFTDGTFNVLFKYPENVLNWLNFLRANEDDNPLKYIFENKKYTIFSLMLAMDDFFRQRDEISISKERGDRIKISEKDGTPYNIINNGNVYEIEQEAKNRIVKFINLLANLTCWPYIKQNWTWNNLKLYQFNKNDFENCGKRINNKNIEEFYLQNPLSWAMTSGINIEYTLETPDKLC